MMAKKKRNIDSKTQQKIKEHKEKVFDGAKEDEKGLTPEEIAEKRIAEWKSNPIGEKLFSSYGSKTRTLQLYNLGLKKMPASIRELKNLEVLNINSNGIEHLPEWIGELKELKAIGLHGNDLRELPQQILKLNNLHTIFLLDNNLQTLPEGLQNLSIKEIFLDGNPALGLPKSILSRSPQEILRYYFESRAEDGQPLRELKLLLVGRGKAGKTTLIKRLAGEETDDNELETHSISIRELTLDCPKGQVRTRAWDFGGQEILHSTHQFFLTERSLYLLVLEPRSDMAQKDAEYWLKLIEAQGGGSPVIIALNHSHENKWKIDEVKLKRKFKFIVDFISTDALMGDGVEQLRQTIIATVQDKMPDVWLPFPKHWRNIKNTVAGMRDNFLTYDQYAKLCKKLGESRLEAQADLAGILHALGLALYFGKDPRLHDTRVLNPGWVTGGVYAVIRSQYVEKNDGQLSLSDMPIVLKEAEDKKVIDTTDYPPETHEFILELMRAFQLCYASDEEENGKPTQYLVPELLSKFEPEMADPWHEAPVRLRYKYTILSPGLLPRFIVQTHALSEGAPHWRHGVVLKHADAQALIRDEPDRSELHVFVFGEDKGARGILVAMVRKELELLHATMKIQPTEELELTGESEQWIGVKALQQIEQPNQAKQKLPVQPEGIAEVDIPLELDKLTPSEVREIDRNQSKMPIPVRLFVSYAHEDERQLKRLDKILVILEDQHGLTSWRDKQRLIAGEDWDEEIRSRLEEMDIFLFIASQTSLVSGYIKNPEIKRALERKKEKQVEIVAVKLEPCAHDDHPDLGKLQRLASNYKSVAEKSPRSIVWEQVRKDLLPVIQKVRNRKAKQ